MPVTWLVIGLLLALQVPVELARPDGDRAVRQVRRDLGAVVEVVYVQERALHGPLDLWQGQWWRIPVTPLLHASLLQLAVTLLLLMWCGSLLEPRIGHLRCLLFYAVVVCVSSLAELLLGRYFTGMLAVPVAGFAFLAVRRHSSSQLNEALPETAVRAGGALLLLGMTCDVLFGGFFPAVAITAGAVWGLLAGLAFPAAGQNAGRLRQTAAIAFVAMHLLLVPAFALCINPYWNGMYHWYLARNEQRPEYRLQHYQQALNRDPSLEKVWQRLALLQAARGRRFRCWQTALSGLRSNRSSELLEKLCRQLWAAFEDLPDRLAAVRLFNETFGTEADAFHARLDLSWNFRVLATHHIDQGELLTAWQTLLDSLTCLPEDQQSLKMLGALWTQLNSEQRQFALQRLAAAFPATAGRLQELAGLIPRGSRPLVAQQPPQSSGDETIPQSSTARFALDQRVVLPPALQSHAPRPADTLRAPPVDPDAPHSAALGVLL